MHRKTIQDQMPYLINSYSALQCTQKCHVLHDAVFIHCSDRLWDKVQQTGVHGYPSPFPFPASFFISLEVALS